MHTSEKKRYREGKDFEDMSVNAMKVLKDALDLGLGIVSRVWDYRTKDWVTSVFAADVNGNGTIDVIACSRDGRVHLLSRNGNRRWERVIGAKSWVGTGVASDLAPDGTHVPARIIVGTRDGKVFVLNKNGQIMTRDGKTLAFDGEGKGANPEQEQQGSWCDTGYVIRQISVDPQRPSTIFVGSEDRCAYGLDYTTGNVAWKYQTSGWVRAICPYDINGDGQDEILVGSVDRYLYLLNNEGNLLEKYYANHPIYAIYAADVDRDGNIEVLMATDGKDLVALNYSAQGFQEKWRRPFENRLLSLCVTDIDGDGSLEIIAGSEDKRIYILDNQGDTLWRHNHKYRVLSIHPCDIDNDGLPELLVGSDARRVRAMRIRLSRDVDKKIRSAYRRLSKADRDRLSELTADERLLLQEVLGTNARETVTFQQARESMDASAYEQALTTLLKLEQQKVEPIWQKDIEYIRTVCLRKVAGEDTLEVIVGTSTGNIHAFNHRGRRSWSTALHDHIVDVQAGFIDRRRQEEIVICSSDHHVYIVSGPQKQKQRNAYIDDTWMSSICVAAPNRRSPAEIIIGSENRKLYIYGSDLQTPIETIITEEGVRIVRAYTPSEGQAWEIVTASLGNHVHAYTRHGESLWSYETRDHIRALGIKDINGDGEVEVLVGSEDRNIHVLDNTGKLLWRYFLPHSVLAIDTRDGGIFVGCADSNLYVLSRDGDLLWSYQTKDRIHAVRVEDIDDDGQVEIVVGSEDQLIVLRIVNQRQVNEMIEQCWTALCQQQPAAQLISSLLTRPDVDPILQAFALKKLMGRNHCTSEDFDILEKLAREGELEVRKMLVYAVMALYPSNPQRTRTLLYQLWTDSKQDVRNALIEHIQALIHHDWELAFHYLGRAADNSDRFARRVMIRTLDQLLTVASERQLSTRGRAFRLLLTAIQDRNSEWVSQEAARTMAHLLDLDHGKLIIYIHLFIVKGMCLKLWEQITHAVTNSTVKSYLVSVIKILFDLSEETALERLQDSIDALAATESFIYGKDIHQIYIELHRLFSIQTLADIANYQCPLSLGQFHANNRYARIVLDVFNKLNFVGRPLKLYSWREGTQDRLASLLEAVEAVDQVYEYVEQQYSLHLLKEPLTRLPDHQILVLLLKKWKRLIQSQLNALRGKAELKAELQTKNARSEEQISLWLTVKNTGSGLASTVKVTFLHDEDYGQFDMVGSNTFETDMILPHEEVTAEFTLRPRCSVLNLKFDIAYDDASNTIQFEQFEDCLVLREVEQDFSYIPNPYSTGTPTQDSKMFYGREKAMAFLKDNLTREAKSVIVLYGQRRFGKTTVLLQLVNTPLLGEHIPVLIDLQRISYIISIDTLLHRIAYYIVQAMKKKNILLPYTPEMSNFKADPTHTFDLFLDQVEELLAERKLILLIDEFEVLEDQVTKGKLQSEIFDYLRDIVQYRKNINFLFSGTHKITEYTRWYRSVFFNIAIHHQISRLSQQGAEDLIMKPVEGYLEYEPLTVKKIRQLTADQPYLIHLMCRAIVDYCNERGKTFVTINDVNLALREVMQTGRFHFEWLWDQITPEDRMALAAIAEGGKEEGRLISFTEIEGLYRANGIIYKRDYILDSIKTLIEADIVEDVQDGIIRARHDSHKYRIPVGLIRTWLLREHPLEVVRREMSE